MVPSIQTYSLTIKHFDTHCEYRNRFLSHPIAQKARNQLIASPVDFGAVREKLLDVEIKSNDSLVKREKRKPSCLGSEINKRVFNICSAHKKHLRRSVKGMRAWFFLFWKQRQAWVASDESKLTNKGSGQAFVSFVASEMRKSTSKHDSKHILHAQTDVSLSVLIKTRGRVSEVRQHGNLVELVKSLQRGFSFKSNLAEIKR